MRRIPLAVPDLSGNESAYVSEAINSTWISSAGSFLERFEREYSEMCQSSHCLAVANGTVALHLALMAIGVGPGDEVIVPSLTYIATANAVRYVGATPVFADVSLDSWCLDTEAVARTITDKTKAIIPVHLYGQPADMAGIMALSEANGITVIEDAAEAPLATYEGRPTGGLGHMGTFSFYGNKIFTSGEGGALTLSDHKLAETARQIRGQGMDPQRRYHFPILGHNFRLTNVAAAILCAQLERSKEIMERRRDIYALYERHLTGVPGIRLQPVVEDTVASPWLYSLLVDDTESPITRDGLLLRLERKGIETRPFFPPVHRQPHFLELYGTPAHLPMTEWLSARGLNLPTYSALSANDIEYVCECLVASLADV